MARISRRLFCILQAFYTCSWRSTTFRYSIGHAFITLLSKTLLINSSFAITRTDTDFRISKYWTKDAWETVFRWAFKLTLAARKSETILKPFIECVETYSANNYNDRREWDKYYQQTSCVFKGDNSISKLGKLLLNLALIREVMSACGCYPNYIDAMKVILVQIYQDRNATNADDLLNATRPCNFLEHAVCVSTIMDHFAIPKFKCLPGKSHF